MAQKTALEHEQHGELIQQRLDAVSENQKRELAALENKIFDEKLPDDKALHGQIAALLEMLKVLEKGRKENERTVNGLQTKMNDLLDWQSMLPSVEDLKEPRVSENDPIKV